MSEEEVKLQNERIAYEKSVLDVKNRILSGAIKMPLNVSQIQVLEELEEILNWITDYPEKHPREYEFKYAELYSYYFELLGHNNLF